MADDIEEHTLNGMDLPPMFWAAVGASAIPMSLGFIGLFFCLVPTEVGRGFYQDYFLAFPAALCFTFGAPLVAWLSCRNLIFNAKAANINLFRLLGAGPVAVKYGFFVHGFAFLTHIILLSIFIDGEVLEIFVLGFIFGGLINGILFIFITMPLSVLCAAIFTRLYSLPIDSLPKCSPEV